jgi:hypothetical protein
VIDIGNVSLSRSDGVQVRFDWGIAGAIPQWVRVGNPLRVHMRNTTLPLGNVGEYMLLLYMSYIRCPYTWPMAYHSRALFPGLLFDPCL